MKKIYTDTVGDAVLCVPRLTCENVLYGAQRTASRIMGIGDYRGGEVVGRPSPVARIKEKWGGGVI
jgi:hypothetical protein